MLIFAAPPEGLLRAWRAAIERELTLAVYVRAMFATGHDAANRAAFKAEPADAPDLVGVALRGAKKQGNRLNRSLPDVGAWQRARVPS